MDEEMSTDSPDTNREERDKTVREILSVTLELAKELQRELGRLQHIVDSSRKSAEPRPEPGEPEEHARDE